MFLEVGRNDVDSRTVPVLSTTIHNQTTYLWWGSYTTGVPFPKTGVSVSLILILGEGDSNKGVTQGLIKFLLSLTR